MKFISQDISDGKKTKTDSLTYVNLIHSRKLRLVIRAKNKLAGEILGKDFLNKGKISKYLTPDVLLPIIEKIPPDKIRDTTLFDHRIALIKTYDDCPTFEKCHSFSNPFHIEGNKYLIYHTAFLYPKQGTSEFVVYRVENHENGYQYIIEKKLVLREH